MALTTKCMEAGDDVREGIEEQGFGCVRVRVLALRQEGTGESHLVCAVRRSLPAPFE